VTAEQLARTARLYFVTFALQTFNFCFWHEGFQTAKSACPASKTEEDNLGNTN